MIITFCPYCGFKNKPLINSGMFACENCDRLVCDVLYTRLVSAAWEVKKRNYITPEELIKKTKINDYEAIIVISFIYDNCYSIEEFSKILNLLGIKYE